MSRVLTLLYCSETMRKPFYVEKWNINRMERYAKATAYVAGKKYFLQIKDTYGCYIQN